jgi:carboxyl-terminal processing protease
VFFDFITNYVRKHKTIAPAEEFAVTDEDFETLKALAKEKNFSYDRQSGKLLSSLKDAARFEGYIDEADSITFKALEDKLTPDIDRDFDRFKAPIQALMSAEIAKRYYYERGELIQNLKEDPVLNKAIEVLNTPGLVEQTLTSSKELPLFVKKGK